MRWLRWQWHRRWCWSCDDYPAFFYDAWATCPVGKEICPYRWDIQARKDLKTRLKNEMLLEHNESLDNIRDSVNLH